MIAGNELQGVQALWCKARWLDEQSRAWLEQSSFPQASSFPPLQQGPLLISKVAICRDVGSLPKSTEALRQQQP